MVGHINRKMLQMFMTRSAPRDLRRLYNSAAAKWHDRMAALGYDDAYRAALASLLDADARRHRVMDAGCGAGSFARAYVAQRGGPDVLTLADPAAAMLHEAATCLAGSASETVLLNCGIEALPVYPTQDLILCAHVIDHCADPVRALRALGQTLAHGGAMLLIVTKPHWCNWLIWLNWRHRSYRPSRMLEAIIAADLTCPRDMGFAKGPPRRTSHAYLVTHTQPEILYADCYR